MNESPRTAQLRITQPIFDVLLGTAPVPTAPEFIYGVRAAAISILAPVLANDLAAFVQTKVQIAAAADILGGDEA